MAQTTGSPISWHASAPTWGQMAVILIGTVAAVSMIFQSSIRDCRMENAALRTEQRTMQGELQFVSGQYTAIKDMLNSDEKSYKRAHSPKPRR